MKIISGGQSGVDRAALDVAIRLGLAYGGWCPRGGWAEDYPDPPGVLAHYPLLRQTPLADPAQRTEWNVRDSDAVLIIVDGRGLAASAGTALGHTLAEQTRKPTLVVDIARPDAPAEARAWLNGQAMACGETLRLGIGGPRQSEAPGIYAEAATFLTTLLSEADTFPRIG